MRLRKCVPRRRSVSWTRFVPGRSRSQGAHQKDKTAARTAPTGLSGLRVVDFSSMFMGPYCSMMLAQWGADVIKVEPPHGDVVRYLGDERNTGMGPIFLNANRGKRSISLDLKRSESSEVLRPLLGKADVVIHNFRPAVEASLRLRGTDVLAHNPQVVCCAFRGFGTSGPYAGRPAYDDIIQAASGMASVQGNGGPPEYVRTVAADKIVGIMGLAAILGALVERASTGSGQLVEVPMFETMASFMLMEQQGGWIFDPPEGADGYVRTASPHRHPYPTKDGYLSVMIYTDAHWRAFFEMVGRTELIDDPRYCSMRERTRNIDELYALVAAELVGRTTGQWQADMEARDIPSMPVNSITDLFRDPHLEAVDFFERVNDRTHGAMRYARAPVIVGKAPSELRPTPSIGQHSLEIARELGLSQRRIGHLTQVGAIGSQATEGLV